LPSLEPWLRKPLKERRAVLVQVVEPRVKPLEPQQVAAELEPARVPLLVQLVPAVRAAQQPESAQALLQAFPPPRSWQA